jgi:hypothetical protein
MKPRPPDLEAIVGELRRQLRVAEGEREAARQLRQELVVRLRAAEEKIIEAEHLGVLKGRLDATNALGRFADDPEQELDAAFRKHLVVWTKVMIKAIREMK